MQIHKISSFHIMAPKFELKNQFINPLKLNISVNKKYNYDSISFSGTDKSLTGYLKRIPKEEWPERVYNAAIEITQKTPPKEQSGVYELHNKIYAPLKNCKTLDEAKAIFPEFANVISFAEVDVSKNKGWIVDMKNGKIEEPDNDLALHLLKYMYGQGELSPIFNGQAQRFYKHLNLDKMMLKGRYKTAIVGNRPECVESSRRSTQNNWANGDHRQKVTEYWTPEQRQKTREITTEQWKNPQNIENFSIFMKSMWQDPHSRERIIDGIKQSQQRPDVKKKKSNATKARWQNPEYREVMTQALYNRWTPDEKQKQSEIMARAWSYKECDVIRERMHQILDEKPFIRIILRKMDEEELTEKEKTILANYYKEIYDPQEIRDALSTAMKKAYKEFEQ